ncbi:MAG: SRPBCC domain-containing protein [Bacteroidetes bacterium]|nr:SRPBCC domain-containing protein [Bacteroidota bacterium]
MNTEPFVIERSYKAPVERVWKALTDKESMKQWYFDIKDFKPEVGFEFHFTGENEGKVFMHLCKIIEVVENKKLKHSWRYDGYEGISYVTWELFDEGNKTRVKLTHEGLETFPPIQDFARENFAGGWKYILGTSLKEFIE